MRAAPAGQWNTRGRRAPADHLAGSQTYTFHLRRSFRFNTGTKLTAGNFAHEIDRIFNPAMVEAGSAADYFSDIVGADDVMNGKTAHAAGVEVAGAYTLRFHLTQPVPDFPARMALVQTCPVPKSLPATPGAVTTRISGSGPYYIESFVPGKRLVLLRNRLYGGSRPQRFNRIVVRFVGGDQTALRAVARGAADWADIGDPSIFKALSKAERKRIRVLRSPAFGVRYLDMNTSRPLFKGNPQLRRAINFALDRRALVRARGGSFYASPADHYLPRRFPGYRPVSIYPLRHPDLRRARGLARGHLRSRVAVLYAQSTRPSVTEADIFRRDLARIGIKVEIQRYPGEQLFTRLFNREEPYDLALTGLFPDWVDPYQFLNLSLEGRQLKSKISANFARFDSPHFNRLLARASRLTGRARFRAYGKIDVEAARDAAPYAAYMNADNFTFVAKRVGCLVGGQVDLAAVCLR